MDSDDLDDRKSNLQVTEIDTDSKLTVVRKQEDFLAETRKEVMTGSEVEIGLVVVICLEAEVFSWNDLIPEFRIFV